MNETDWTSTIYCPIFGPSGEGPTYVQTDRTDTEGSIEVACVKTSINSEPSGVTDFTNLDLIRTFRVFEISKPKIPAVKFEMVVKITYTSRSEGAFVEKHLELRSLNTPVEKEKVLDPYTVLPSSMEIESISTKWASALVLALLESPKGSSFQWSKEVKLN